MYLHIDSRNKPDGSSSNSFVLTLPEPIKNVSKCSIINAKFDQVTPGDPFIFVDIAELRSDQMSDAPKFISSESFESKNINRFIGIIPNNGLYYDPRNKVSTVFEPTLTMFKLTIRITDYKGIPVVLPGNFTLLLNLETIPETDDEPTTPEPQHVHVDPKQVISPFILFLIGFLILIAIMQFRPRHK